MCIIIIIIIIIIFLSSVALPHISVNFCAIASEFGLSIALDEENKSFKFQVNTTKGRDRAWSQIF